MLQWWSRANPLPRPLRNVSISSFEHLAWLRLEAGTPDGAASGRPVDDADATTAQDLDRLRKRLLRLAFDIHDGPLQSLAAAGFGLNDLQERIGALPLENEERGAASRVLTDVLAELTETERILRGLVGTLEDSRPEIPLAKDILESETERFRRRCAAEVVVEGDWSFHPDSRSQALTLEALLRESLQNVGKHAHASVVVVRLQESKTHLLVEIEDDGRGFDPRAHRGARIGITGMRERVKLLGGELSILSKPGGPTVVTAVLRRWRRPTVGSSYTDLPVA
jgi:signal transduction histidine kinase